MNLPKLAIAALLMATLAACTDQEINDGIAAVEGKPTSYATQDVVALKGAYTEGSAVISDIIVVSSSALSSESSSEVVSALPMPPSSSSSSEVCVPVFRVRECD